MKVPRPMTVFTLGGLIGIVAAVLAALNVPAVLGQAQQQAPPDDWAAAEQALGKSGQMMPGDVFRIGMPRTDLNVTVQGVPVKAEFALGSYAAFKQIGDETLMMGDLVLLDDEVNPVMFGLFAGGLEITALHNHLNEMSPHVMYMHYLGRGDAARLATALRQALAASGTPLGGGSASVPADGPALDTAQIEAVMGHTGRMMAGGVFQVSVSRVETVTDMGVEIPPAMGVAMPFNFQPLRDGRAAITGDFVLRANEVNPVASTLRASGIEVQAVHNHGLGDEPRLFYMHFWAVDDPLKLARGLRAALDQTNTEVGDGRQ